MKRAALIAALMLLLGGCGGSEPSSKRSDEQAIRGWIGALNAGDYRRAASFFAPGAVVEQVEVFRLPDRRAAEAFNRSLPCRADLTDLKYEGKTTLAAFRLRAGPGGPCHGGARVRFTVRRGRFTEWRQLPERTPGKIV